MKDFIKRGVLNGNIWYAMAPLAIVVAVGFAAMLDKVAKVEDTNSAKIEISYGGNPDYKDGDEIDRPLSDNFFSIMCYEKRNPECVIDIHRGSSEDIKRFPYVKREWLINGKTLLRTVEQVKSLPSYNGNPSWNCSDKKSCELVMTTARSIGW